MNTTGHYTQHITSLNRFTGQTIKLRFTGKETFAGGHRAAVRAPTLT